MTDNACQGYCVLMPHIISFSLDVGRTRGNTQHLVGANASYHFFFLGLRVAYNYRERGKKGANASYHFFFLGPNCFEKGFKKGMVLMPHIISFSLDDACVEYLR